MRRFYTASSAAAAAARSLCAERCLPGSSAAAARSLCAERCLPGSCGGLAAAAAHERRWASSVARKGALGRKETAYVCTSCGHDTVKWHGQCPSCGEHDTMKEMRFPSASAAPGGARNVSPSAYRQSTQTHSPTAPQQRTWLDASALLSKAPAGGLLSAGGSASHLVPLRSVPDGLASARARFGSTELDMLFGGGLTLGSVTLVGGSPGVGKSTLLLQMAALLCKSERDGKPYADFFRNTPPSSTPTPAPTPTTSPHPVVAYISGEEAAGQLRSRAARLGVDAPGLLVLNETRIESVLEQLEAAGAALGPASHPAASPFTAVIVDSIQTMWTDASTSPAGTVGQVRECAARLVAWAKATGTPVLLVGHVTKSGDLAGPRVLEHMVDAVMMVEGEESLGSGGSGGGGGGGGDGGGAAFFHSHRVLRCLKNRFGSTHEVAIFQMTHDGFVESSATRMFLSHAPGDGASEAPPSGPPGCAVTVTTEGSRALAVEVQALCARASGPYPRHRAMGISNDRLHMLTAVLTQHTQGLLKSIRAATTASAAGRDDDEAASDDDGGEHGNGDPRARALASLLHQQRQQRRSPSSSSSSGTSSASSPTSVSLNWSDVLVNVVGGLRVSDPSSDAAVAVAIASSATSAPAPPATVFIGELGLGGELRGGGRLEDRLRAASAAGFRRAFVPRGSVPRGRNGSTPSTVAGVSVVEVRTIGEMVERALGNTQRQQRGGRTLRVAAADDGPRARVSQPDADASEGRPMAPFPHMDAGGLDSSLDDEGGPPADEPATSSPTTTLSSLVSPDTLAAMVGRAQRGVRAAPGNGDDVPPPPPAPPQRPSTPAAPSADEAARWAALMAHGPAGLDSTEDFGEYEGEATEGEGRRPTGR
jgi:DNA repair protein RadA/Sms